MALKLKFRPTNRRVRLVVGALLVGMFCVLFAANSEANRLHDKLINATDGKVLGQNDDDVMLKVEHMAKTDHVALLEYCLKQYKGRYVDYTCTLLKEERINGVLSPQQAIDVKFKENPFSVSMHWVENAPVGDRVLYVQGKFDNQMLVRPTNQLLRKLVPTALRKPDGQEAMKNTLRPVNQFGFERSLRNLLDVYVQARQCGDLTASGMTFGGYSDVAGRKTLALVRYLPAKDNYPAHKTVIYIDTEYLLPTCVEGYDWDGQLSCRYIYKNVKFNTGLKDEDFRPENNEMKSPE